MLPFGAGAKAIGVDEVIDVADRYNPGVRIAGRIPDVAPGSSLPVIFAVKQCALPVFETL